jgi:hypothetical protein
MSGVTAAKVNADMSGSTRFTTPWVRALGGQGTVFFNAGAYHSTPSGFNLANIGTSAPPQEPTNLLCGGTGYNGYGCSGGAFKVGSSTDATIAQALRQKLTAPGDTCGGAPCPWGDNGGDPDASTTYDNSNTISCVLAGDCSATPLVPSFTMPDCYGLTASACLANMQTLGFTGTLDSSIASSGDLDITQSAGAVLFTDPTAGSHVSKLADDVATDYQNPQGCKWNVQNPHESDGSPGQIDVKATATCDYETTIVGNLTLWKCDEQPSPDLAQLMDGAWGCVETLGTVVDDSRLAEPDAPQTFQVPPPGSDIDISPDGKYFIAYGTLDPGAGTPLSAFSNVVGPLN